MHSRRLNAQGCMCHCKEGMQVTKGRAIARSRTHKCRAERARVRVRCTMSRPPPCASAALETQCSVTAILLSYAHQANGLTGKIKATH